MASRYRAPTHGDGERLTAPVRPTWALDRYRDRETHTHTHTQKERTIGAVARHNTTGLARTQQTRHGVWRKDARAVSPSSALWPHPRTTLRARRPASDARGGSTPGRLCRYRGPRRSGVTAAVCRRSAAARSRRPGPAPSHHPPSCSGHAPPPPPQEPEPLRRPG